MSSSPDFAAAFRRRRAAARVLKTVVCVLAAYVTLVRLVPRILPYAGQDTLDGLRFSTVLLDAEGGELQILPLDHGLRRLYMPASQQPATLRRLVLRAEDKRFYAHPGVDPIALGRALLQNLSGGGTVSGASTLSMQVARLITPRPRTVGAKLAEAWEALQLESRLGKAGVLDLYLNLLPFGRNVEGFPAAARAYYGKDLSLLTDAQLMALCVIPRSPSAYDPHDHPKAVMEAVRRLALLAGYDKELASRLAGEAVDGALDAERRDMWPFRAPHYVAWLQSSGTLDREPRASRTPIVTGIEPDLQAYLEGLLADTVAEARDKRVSNAAALFVRPADMRIAAWVGSIDFFDPETGQVDGVTMRRQPGSTLKPFLYALALEQGFTASTVLPDVPSDFGGAEVYVPANFNNQFNGPVRLRQALASSLNIPAVYTLERLGVSRFSEFLLDLGFDSLRDQLGNLGLGLALGNAEVSLYELVRAYGSFIHGGQRVILNNGPACQPIEDPDGVPVMDPRIAALVRDILTRHPDRALVFGLANRLRFEGAMKTGTSNQFNNIWAVGFTTDLLGGVWMGNFSGATVVGTADSGYPATILSKTLERFSAHAPFPPLAGLEKKQVCALSGMAPSEHCPHVIDEWFLPGTELAMCDWHQAGPNGTRINYPQEYAAWLARYRYTGAGTASSSDLRITRPVDGAVFYVNPAEPVEAQGFLLQATGSGTGSVDLDGSTYWTGSFPASVWLPLHTGSHRVDVFQDGGGSAGVRVEVR